MKTVDEEELLTVSINTVKRSDIISVTPKIEKKYLKMELDTGSAISVIPIRIYKELFHHKPLSVTNTILKTYSGQTITAAGIINVSVNYEGQEHNLDLFVVKNDSPTLFGRAWLKYMALDKLLGQLGIYTTWLSSIAYLQKQLLIFIFFTPRFFFLLFHLFLLHEAIGNVLAYLFTPIVCLSRVSNSPILLYLKQISSPCCHSSVYTLQSFTFILVFFREIRDWAPIFS